MSLEKISVEPTTYETYRVAFFNKIYRQYVKDQLKILFRVLFLTLYSHMCVKKWHEGNYYDDKL